MAEPIFDHERLDVYRLSIAYVAFSYHIAKSLVGIVAYRLERSKCTIHARTAEQTTPRLSKPFLGKQTQS